MTVTVNGLRSSSGKRTFLCDSRTTALRPKIMQLWLSPPFSSALFLLEEIYDVKFKCEYRTVCFTSFFYLACRAVG